MRPLAKVRPAARPDACAVLHQAAAVLLSYPEEDWPERVALVRAALAAVPGRQAQGLRRFCAAVQGVAPLDLAARYTATFDRSRRRSLHLTYYSDGDTRRRGAALVRLKARYRRHGLEVAGGELPDFLPAVLEFAACCPRDGARLLRQHRAALELLGAALAEYGSPYADVLDAVRAGLPAPGGDDRAAVRRLARGGPPQERVGLDPGPYPPGPDTGKGARP